MQPKIEVGILGATGMVGQHFMRFLQGHPWFEVTWLGASDRSAGKTYREATSWRLDGVMPANVEGMKVEDCKPGNAPRLVFSSMDASVATGGTVQNGQQPASDVPLTPQAQERSQRLWWYLLATGILLLGVDTLFSNWLSKT